MLSSINEIANRLENDRRRLELQAKREREAQVEAERRELAEKHDRWSRAIAHALDETDDEADEETIAEMLAERPPSSRNQLVEDLKRISGLLELADTADAAGERIREASENRVAARQEAKRIVDDAELELRAARVHSSKVSDAKVALQRMAVKYSWLFDWDEKTGRLKIKHSNRETPSDPVYGDYISALLNGSSDGQYERAFRTLVNDASEELSIKAACEYVGKHWPRTLAMARYEVAMAQGQPNAESLLNQATAMGEDSLPAHVAKIIDSATGVTSQPDECIANS